LLAVPITAAAAIVCGEFERTRWIALLIARERSGRGSGAIG
jgi:hypothetical protein